MKFKLEVDDMPDLAKEAEMPVLVNEVQRRLLDHAFPVTPKMDFEIIAKFIRTRKYDVDSALTAFKTYYEHIGRNLRRIEGIKPSQYISAFESKMFVILKHKVNGTKILCLNVNCWDPKKVSLKELQSGGLLLVEESLRNTEIQPYGSILILDVGGLGFSHLKQLTLPELKYTIQIGLEGLPTRVAAVHVVNAPVVFWPLYTAVLKFLPHKIKKRIHIHSNMASLHEHIDRKVLPKCLDGALEIEDAMDMDLVHKVLKNDIAYEDYWSGESSYRRPRRMSRKRSSMKISQSNEAPMLFAADICST